MLNFLRMILSSAVAFFASGCSSLKQTSDEVYLRNSGDVLKPWKSSVEASEQHWPFAWASYSAYLHEADGKALIVTEECPEPHGLLESRGWELWEELPRVGRKSQVNSELERRLQNAHLRAEVWSNQAENTVIVAFGGTASLRDFSSNARWLLPSTDKDAYGILTNAYVPAFVASYEARAREENGSWLRNARIVSTGHSLGGGLAQRFAYSVKPTIDMPGIREVYGFDPSPVSGKRDVPDFRSRANGLTIYRIYNRGEILATVRSILQWANPANARNDGQTWIDIRYADGWGARTLLPSGWIRAHGMRQLACFMNKRRPISPPSG